MQEFLKNWASGLIVAIIIVTIIELLIPENRNKKYIKLVSGIFILFTIISPVVVHFNGNVELNIDKYSDILTSSNYDDISEVATVVTDDAVMEVYEKNISNNIKNSVENLNYIVDEIELEIRDKDDYGAISSISLIVRPVELTSEASVKPVEIDVSVTKSKKKKEYALTENDKNIIRQLLNQDYRISSDKIRIN